MNVATIAHINNFIAFKKAHLNLIAGVLLIMFYYYDLYVLA